MSAMARLDRPGARRVLLVVRRAHIADLRPKLEGSLAVAAFRMVVQLSAVGLVLKFVFAPKPRPHGRRWLRGDGPGGGLRAAGAQDKRMRSWLTYRLGSLTLLLVGGFATLLCRRRSKSGRSPGTRPASCCRSWHGAGQYTDQRQPGAADPYREHRRERAAIEARIALARPALQRSHRAAASLRTAMTPLLNTMAVSGVVALPGMMTGQITAGADPPRPPVSVDDHVRAFGRVGIRCAGSGAGYGAMLSDRRHRLRLDRLLRRDARRAASIPIRQASAFLLGRLFLAGAFSAAAFPWRPLRPRPAHLRFGLAGMLVDHDQV